VAFFVTVHFLVASVYSGIPFFLSKSIIRLQAGDVVK
jgi:hypothetical protein